MRSFFVRAGVAIAAAVTMAACGADEAGAEKMELLSVGMSADSLFAVLPQGPVTGDGADTARVRDGYRLSRYLVNGQIYTVVYVRDIPGSVEEPVEQRRETPIVLDGSNAVVGWGWKFYVDEGMKKLGLPTPLSDTSTVVPPPVSARSVPSIPPLASTPSTWIDRTA